MSVIAVAVAVRRALFVGTTLAVLACGLAVVDSAVAAPSKAKAPATKANGSAKPDDASADEAGSSEETDETADDAEESQEKKEPAKSSGSASVGASGSSIADSSGARPRPTSPLMPSVIGFGPGFFFEETDIVQDRFVNGGRDGEVQRDERVSDGIFELQAWVLFPVLLERLRFGGGIAWFNAYTLEFPDDEDNDDKYEVGHTFQLFMQAEYVLADVASKLDVMFGLRAGGIVTFPGDDVQDRLDELEQRQFDVIQSPRLGAFIGPHVGVIWPLNDRLALRCDASIQFSKIGLYDAEAEASGTLVEVNGHINTTRTLVLLGLEFGL